MSSAKDLQVVPALGGILEWLKYEKGCPSIRKIEVANGWWAVETPNRSIFWMVLENDSRTQELQISVDNCNWANLGACELADPDMFDRLAEILGLPLDPPVPAGTVAPNPGRR